MNEITFVHAEINGVVTAMSEEELHVKSNLKPTKEQLEKEKKKILELKESEDYEEFE